MSDKINIKQIFQKHKDTLKSVTYEHSENSTTKILKLKGSDKFTFYWLPIIIACLLVFCIGIPNENTTSFFVICLSIFIGLFLNLLIMITTFLRPDSYVKDSITRTELIEHTFYNISYTILISLIGLGYLFLAVHKILPTKWGINLSFLKIECISYISANFILNFIFSFLLYYILVKIVLTLLMIIKRVFSLFKVDIHEFKNELKEKHNDKLRNNS